MKGLKGLLIFAAGAVVGAVAGAYAVKDKAMKDAEEEIAEVREYYKRKEEPARSEAKAESKPENSPEEKIEKTNQEAEEKEYKEIVKNNGYTNYSNYADDTVIEKIDTPDPYVIEPEEFGEEVGYDTITLTYFMDGVLIDDVDEVIDNPDEVVGHENLLIFDEFDARTVYLRDDILKIDYEIIRDDCKYTDVSWDYPNDKKPHEL